MSKPSSIPIFTISGTSIERETAGVKVAIYKADPATGLKDTVAIAGIDIIASGNPNDYEFDVDANSHITVTALKSQLFWIVNGATEYPQWISKDGGSKGEDAVITILSGGFSYWGHNVYDDGTDIFATSNSANGCYVVLFNGADRNYVVYQKASVAADEKINVVANLHRPVVEYTLANGKRFFGFNVDADVTGNKINTIIAGDAWAIEYDDAGNAVNYYQATGLGAGAQLNLAKYRFHYQKTFTLSNGHEFFGLNVEKNAANNDIVTVADGVAWAIIIDPTDIFIKMYAIGDAATAGDSLIAVATEFGAFIIGSSAHTILARGESKRAILQASSNNGANAYNLLMDADQTAGKPMKLWCGTPVGDKRGMAIIGEGNDEADAAIRLDEFKNVFYPNLTTYADDDAADADNDLPSGGAYLLTGDRAKYIKP